MTGDDTLVCDTCSESWASTMRFCGSCGAPLDPSTGRRASEFRQLTIVFCDVVGSTALSGRLEPEEYRDLIHAFHVLSEQTITEAGGFVVQFLGDGVLACFGAPIAYDDAPARGVRAACSLVAATGSIETRAGDPPLASRAGVHTGAIVLDSVLAGTARVQLELMGEAANLAARLQSAAEPGHVIVSGATAELIGTRFELDGGTELSLKGIGYAVHGFRVLGMSADDDRLDSRHRPAEAQLVARDAELSILLARCRLAAEGSPQFVVLVGEPGIGKSRLLRESRDSPMRPAGRIIVLRGQQDRSTTPFAPIIEIIDSQGSEMSAWFGDELSDLLLPGRSAADGETPDRRRRRLLDLICDGVIGLGHTEVVTVLIDDLQWCDPSTLELLGLLRERALDARLAVLTAARPEWSSPWPVADDVTVLPLPRLAPDDIRRMLDELQVTDEAVVRQVIDRSEGVPLFLEEFARQRRESGGDRGDRVPTSVNDLLRARLDRMGSVLDLELVRECSVFGRDVDVAVAAVALGIAEDELRDRLRAITASGVVRERAGGHRFTFQHILLRDAAYDTMLRSRRTRLHRAAAEAIAAQPADVVARSIEQLARHWTAAGAHEEAFRAWMKAGRSARDRTALTEALAHFRNAGDVLADMEPSPERDRRELDMLLASGPVGYRVMGGAHQQLSANYRRAEELCVGETDPNRRFGGLLGVFTFWICRPDLDKAAATGDQLLELAEQLPSAQHMAHYLVGAESFLRGDTRAARFHFEYCLSHLENAPSTAFPGFDAQAVALLASMDAADGDAAAATAGYERARAMVMSLADPNFELSWLEHVIAKTHALAGDAEFARLHASRVAELAEQFDFAQIAPHAASLLAWADASSVDDADRIDGAIAEMRDALAAIETCGSRAESSLHHLLLVRVLRRSGRSDEAADELARAIAYVDETGERLHMALLEAEQVALTPR